MLENIQLGLIFGGLMLFCAIAIPVVFMGLCFLTGATNGAKTIFSFLKWIFHLYLITLKFLLSYY